MFRSSVSIITYFVAVFSTLNPVQSQPLADTLFYWEDYGRPSKCRIQVYKAPPEDNHTHTFVLQEIADNQGISAANDAQILVTLVGRHFGVEPSEAYWIFHWGAFSFYDARHDDRRELFLRATFRRGKNRTIGTPSWRVVSREDVEIITDRLFR